MPSSDMLPYVALVRKYVPEETTALTRTTRHSIPEDGILYNHRRENVKSYMALTGWAL
jgi:hypothetical protein